MCTVRYSFATLTLRVKPRERGCPTNPDTVSALKFFFASHYSAITQSIRPHRVVVKQLLLLLFASFLDNGLKSGEPLLVRGDLRAHGPIAAEHNAVGAERIERVIDD